MHHLLDPRAAFDNSGVLLLDVVLKATLLLQLAGGANVVLRQRSAALRHRVWCLAFGGLLILPVLATLLPSWRLPILPPPADDTSATNADSAGPITEPPARDAASESVAETELLTDPLEWNTGHPFNLDRAPMSWETMQPSQTFAALPPTVTETSAESALQPATDRTSESVADDTAAPAHWGTIICGLWLLGACLAVWPLVAGFARNGALHRAARTFDETTAAEWIQTLCTSLGLRRRVRLLETGRAIVPMTWGILRPVVLFPVAWREWTQKRRRLVLLHELAHVKRCDVAFQLIARLACALYWFHPLAWYALRRLRIERELACDDCVLMTGARPSDYAQELVEIARNYQSLALPTTVAMAHTTNLEHRIRALLDRARPHLPLSRTAGRLLLLAAIILVTGVAVVRPSPREDQVEPPSKTEIVDDARDSSADQTPATTAPPANDDPVNRETPSPAEGAAKPQAAAAVASGEDLTLHYRGRVVDPEGQPVGGAQLYFVYWVHGPTPPQDVEPQAVTGADGWFDFTATCADIGVGAESAYASNFSFPLVAIADGYGFAEQLSPVFETTGKAVDRLPAQQREYFEQRFKDAEPVLRLVKDDVPIRGRVINTEGQPVAGVRIAVDRFWYNEDGNLDAWEAAAKEDKADFYSLRQHTPQITNGPQMRSVIPDVTTDSDGRFTMRGIGRERVVQVLISGPGIETNQVKARTRDGETIEVPNTSQRERGPDNREAYHPAELTHVAAPSIPVIGRITDADTGEPIPDVTVSAGQRATFLAGGKYWITTSTDADGRYRLEGLPTGSAEDIYVLPPDDSAYLPASRGVRTRLSEDAEAHDFVVKQGLWVRGQAVDARTGEPLPGRAQYYVDSGNPHLEEYAAFARGYVIHERRADARGRFAIPVLPGRGIVTFTPDDHSKYRRGVGAETITIPGEIFDVKRQAKSFRVKPSMLASSNEAVLHEINPPVDSEPLEIVLRPVSGMEVVGKLLDPDGRPLTEGRIQVVGTPLHYPRFDTNQHVFRLEAYFPDEPCEVFFFHVERNLAGTLRLEGEPPENLTVTLHPAGGIRGRLVDEDGIPMTGMYLTGEGIPTQSYGDTDLRLATDDDGRFLIRGLIPGRKYTVEARGDRLSGRVLIDESVDTPETKDVGDVTLQPPDRTKISPSPAAAPTPPKQPANQKTSSNASEGAAKPQAAATRTAGALISLRGRVTGPDGRPVGNAQVWVQRRSGSEREWLPLAQSSREGWWSAASEHTRFEATLTENPAATVRLAATADRYGFAWTDVKIATLEELITLQLVQDVPIEGRILTIDGQPAARVQVTASELKQPTEPPLDEFIELLRSRAVDSRTYPYPGFWDKDLPGQTPAVTDAEGRFRIAGLGADRLLTLLLAGEGLHHWSMLVVARRPPPEVEGGLIARAGEGGQDAYYASFEHIAQPGRTLRGMVREAGTGLPIAGAKVSAWSLTKAESTTDESGQFALPGCRKVDEYQVTVRPSDGLHFARQFTVGDKAGIGPLDVSFDLQRGIPVTGRVTDADGKPVRAEVSYYPLRGNEQAEQAGPVHIHPPYSCMVEKDGSYQIPVFSGPGVIGVNAFGNGYLSASLDLQQYKQLVDNTGVDEISKDKGMLAAAWGTWARIEYYNALALINPEAGTESLQQDITVTTGISREGRIVDPEGQPLSGVRVSGLEGPTFGFRAALELPEFKIEGLKPDESRSLLFYHPERRFAANVVVSADETETLAICLQPCGKATGRVVDRSGEPVVGIPIEFCPKVPQVHIGSGTWMAQTDELGRFEIDSLIDGMEYRLFSKGRGGVIRPLAADSFNAGSGQTKDLGDIQVGD